jgi:hypothetical protein
MLIFAAFLHPSAPGAFLIACVIGICAGIGLFIYGFRLLQRRRLILDTPFSKIRSASAGMVEVSGLAVGPHTMMAPITAKPCYYYRTVVREWKRCGKNSEWVMAAEECMHVPFFLDDNTGCVLVDPRGADLDLHCDFQQEFCDSFFTTKDPAPSNVRTFLARYGIVTSNKIRVEEFCIKPKNALFILGTLAENPGLKVTPIAIRENLHDTSSNSVSVTFSNSFSNGIVSGDFDVGSCAEQMMGQKDESQSNAALQVIRLSAEGVPVKSTDMTQQQVISAALLRAGMATPAAWAAGVGIPGVEASEDAAVIADASRSSGSGAGADKAGFDSHPPVVLMKGTNNKTFLISWRSQQDIARSLGWRCMLMIWGGPALVLFSLYVLFSIENWL